MRLTKLTECSRTNNMNTLRCFKTKRLTFRVKKPTIGAKKIGHKTQEKNPEEDHATTLVLGKGLGELEGTLRIPEADQGTDTDPHQGNQDHAPAIGETPTAGTGEITHVKVTVESNLHHTTVTSNAIGVGITDIMPIIV